MHLTHPHARTPPHPPIHGLTHLGAHPPRSPPTCPRILKHIPTRPPLHLCASIHALLPPHPSPHTLLVSLIHTAGNKQTSTNAKSEYESPRQLDIKQDKSMSNANRRLSAGGRRTNYSFTPPFSQCTSNLLSQAARILQLPPTERPLLHQLHTAQLAGDTASDGKSFRVTADAHQRHSESPPLTEHILGAICHCPFPLTTGAQKYREVPKCVRPAVPTGTPTPLLCSSPQTLGSLLWSEPELAAEVISAAEAWKKGVVVLQCSIAPPKAA